MQVLLTSIGFTNFFRCLIFEFFLFTNVDVVTKMRHLNKTNGGKIKEQDALNRYVDQDKWQISWRNNFSFRRFEIRENKHMMKSL